MSEPNQDQKRRLAAVVFTDVVGYSARMQRDESATISGVEKDLARMRALCVEYGGEVVNSMGDGLMMCFPSAVKGVEFALRVQGEFAARNSSSTEPMEHRIGVHLGDIVSLENGSVAGDGVNIASRLEAKSPPGGICISQTVYDTVRGKVPMRATYAGEQSLKNIAQPVPVWLVRPEGITGAEIIAASTSTHPTSRSPALRRRLKSWTLAILSFVILVAGAGLYWNTLQNPRTGIPSVHASGTEQSAGPLSIVVLPFTNLSGDINQAYVADGMTASLTADLSRIRDAFIVNAATAYTYRDKSVSAQQVGKELGARFVLQGSVQRGGTRIRINAQLADTTSNAQLWSETFEGDQSDLFALQDQVTARIGNSIGREIVIVAGREAEKRKSNPNAADLMLRIRALTVKSVQSLITLQQIETLCRELLALEPNHAGALGYLATSLTLQASNFGDQIGPDIREKKYVEGREIAAKTKELDPSNPTSYMAIAMYAAAHEDYPGYRRAVETSVSLNPKFPGAYLNLGNALLRGGEAQKGIEVLTHAISLDPKHPFAAIFESMSWGYFMLGDNDAAIEWALKASENNPSSPYPYAYLAMAYALKGDNPKARAAAADLRRVNPAFSLKLFAPDPSRPVAYKQYFEKRHVPAWRKAELPE